MTLGLVMNEITSALNSLWCQTIRTLKALLWKLLSLGCESLYRFNFGYTIEYRSEVG